MPHVAPRFGQGLIPAWYQPRAAALADLVDDFVARCDSPGFSPRTKESYRKTMAEFVAWCATRALEDPRAISPEHLADYANYLQTRPARPPGGILHLGRPMPPRRLSPHYVDRLLRAVRAFFNWCKLNRYIEMSPFEVWSWRTPKLPPQRGFTIRDVRAMLDATYLQAENARRDRAMVLVLFDTAVRVEELTRLDLDDILDEQLRVRRSLVVRGKGDKHRTVEVNPQTRLAIEEFLRHERAPDADSAAFVLGRGGTRLQGEGVYRVVNRLAKRAGLVGKRLSPHTFRHGFAKVYLEQDGARVDDLQRLLGHESIQMSLHYAKQVNAEARRGARSYSPVNDLGLALGKRLQRGRPRKSP